MLTRYLWLTAILAVSLSILTSCSTSSSKSIGAGAGFLWLTAQGNATVQAYTIALSSGGLSLDGSAVPSGPTPTAIVITPKGDAAFILNSGASSSGISAFTINSDGTFKASGSMVPVQDVAAPSPNVCPNPKGFATDPAGKFLFVACQGAFSDPNSGAIYTFSITGAALAPIGVRTPSVVTSSFGAGPVSLTVSASGNYLYVANQFTDSVSSFQVASSGALTALNNYTVGTAPSAVFVSVAQGTTVAAGQYLYVANTGSNNISAFAICDAQNGTGCSTVNGDLVPVSGSPFPAQPGPVAIAMDPNAAFLYVADEQANQISQYSWSSGTGALTPLATANVSAGGSPVSLAIRSGITASNTTAGTDYMYVTNLNGSSLSVYSLNTTTGALNVLGTPTTTPAQPSAVIVR